jgi:hypothetical protein
VKQSVIIRVIKSRRVRCARNVACIGEMRSASSVLVGKPEGKRPLGRPKRSWENNIRMDLTEVGWKDVDWIHLAHTMEQWLAVVNTAMNHGVP